MHPLRLVPTVGATAHLGGSSACTLGDKGRSADVRGAWAVGFEAARGGR
jgi:hypothetical protein